MGLNKHELLAGSKTRTKVVEVPELGTVHVRIMTGSERDDYQGKLRNADGTLEYENFRAKLLIKTLCDEQGNRLFTDSEADVKAVGAMRSDHVAILFDAASDFNIASAKEVEDKAKNS